jgi:putative lipoic acid-binding regulatory protein
MMDIPVEESLIKYPCHFPIKVMGKAVDGYQQAIEKVVLNFDPDFDVKTIECRPSKNGNYLGLSDQQRTVR